MPQDTQTLVAPSDEGIRKILEGDFHNEAFKRVQRDPEMFAIVTDIEQNLGTLTQIIISGSLSPKTVERLRTVAADGVALLAACIAFGSVAETPGSIMVEVDRWNEWVETTTTAMALASAGKQ